MRKFFNNTINGAYFKAKAFLTEEKGAVDIVAIVILIAIAVVLAVIFRNNIVNLINNMFKSIGENTKDIATVDNNTVINAN